MNMNTPLLPPAFVNAVRELLGPEAEAMLDTYTEPRTQGLRMNTLKSAGGAGAAAAARAADLFRLEPVPWCPEGFYYEDPVRPGKHPYHAAGLYYIQEPSAMSAAVLLNPQPGERILDLAAAPGGKTTAIAARMEGKGLLVSNEIHPERARILAENVERLGIANTVVTCATPGELARRFPERFDRIMLDAPCSGEGMFRKDPGAIQEWSPEHVELCAARQWDIVQDACRMLKPGGTLAYSTCTFNRAENEELVARIILGCPGMELIEAHRLWPHRIKGEGHFIALLRKGPEEDPDAEAYERAAEEHPAAAQAERRGQRGGKPGRAGSPRVPGQAAEALRAVREWAAQDAPGLELSGVPLLFGEALYLLPEDFADPRSGFAPEQLNGLKTPRPGLHVAQLKKNRIEPAHALAMAMSPEQAARTFNLAADASETAAWLRGESLPVEASLRGWCLVTVDGLPLGWGKASGGQLKNHLPKGLRIP